MEEKYIPIHELQSYRLLPLGEQAEMLLHVLASEVIDQNCDAIARRPIDDAVTVIDGRQTFRNVWQSMCRPLGKEQTREFAEFVMLKLADRIRPVSAATDSAQSATA